MPLIIHNRQNTVSEEEAIQYRGSYPTVAAALADVGTLDGRHTSDSFIINGVPHRVSGNTLVIDDTKTPVQIAPADGFKLTEAQWDANVTVVLNNAGNYEYHLADKIAHPTYAAYDAETTFAARHKIVGGGAITNNLTTADIATDPEAVTGADATKIPNVVQLKELLDKGFYTAATGTPAKNGDKIRLPETETLSLSATPQDGDTYTIAPFNNPPDWLTMAAINIDPQGTNTVGAGQNIELDDGTALLTLVFSAADSNYTMYLGGDSYDPPQRTVATLASLTALDITQFALGALIGVTQEEANNGVWQAVRDDAGTVPTRWEKQRA